MDPPGGSKSPQDGPKHGQDGLRSTQECSKTFLKSVFVAVQNRLRFSAVWGSFWDRFWLPLAFSNASLWAPFWRSKSTQKSIRNPTALKVVPRSPQERPRLSQDAPRTPADTPWAPQDASWTPPARPQMPCRTLPDDPKAFPEASGTIAFFGKIEKVEVVQIRSKKQQPCSSTVVARHNRSQKTEVLSQRSSPSGGGGRAAKRSSI